MQLGSRVRPGCMTCRSSLQRWQVSYPSAMREVEMEGSTGMEGFNLYATDEDCGSLLEVEPKGLERS